MFTRFALLVFFLLLLFQHSVSDSGASGRARYHGHVRQILNSEYSECQGTDYNNSVYYGLAEACPLDVSSRRFYFIPTPNKTILLKQYYIPVFHANLKCQTICNSTDTSVVNSPRELFRVLGHKFRSTGASIAAAAATTSTTTAATNARGSEVVEPWCGLEEVSEGYWVARELWAPRCLSPFPLGKESGSSSSSSPPSCSRTGGNSDDSMFFALMKRGNKRITKRQRQGRSVIHPSAKSANSGGSSSSGSGGRRSSSGTNGSLSELAISADMLSKVFSGDVATALTWPYTWVPKHCRMFYYNISSLLRCGAKWKQRTGHPLWIHILGDSVSRGLFCGVLRMLSPGGECQGAWTNFPCDQGLPLGLKLTEYELSPKHVELTYTCPLHSLRLSHYFVHGLNFPWWGSLLEGVLGNKTRGQPSVIVLNTGLWEMEATLRRSKGVWEYVHHGTKADQMDMLQQRPRLMREFLRQLQLYRFQGWLIYRSSLCNGHYHGRAWDAGVEAEVLNLRKRRSHPPPFTSSVLNLFRASECRGSELMADAGHFDRHILRRPPTEKPSLGSLNSALMQAMLNGICNPLLFPSAA